MTDRQKTEFEKAEKLSDMLGIAIDEMRGLNRFRFYPEARRWFTYLGSTLYENARCHVCLAGAVIAGGVERGEWESDFSRHNRIHPLDFENEIQRKFLAIDSLRAGFIERAFNQICRPFPKDFDGDEKLPRRVDIKNHDFESWVEADQFLVEMDKVKNMLIAAGE